MSSKDKISIYKVVIIIITIVLLTWLNSISKVITWPYEFDLISSMFLPIVITILAAALLIKLIIFMKKITIKALIRKERYRSLYCQAQIGLTTTTFDGSRIIMANPKMLEMFGYDTFNEIEGLSAYNLWANPSDRLHFINQLQTYRKLSAYKFKGLCKDGTTKDFEIYAIYNSKLGYIESNVIDVTEKQEYEKKLVYQATLLENIQESIIVIDTNGIIQFFNQQAKKLFNIDDRRLIQEVVPKILEPYDENKITEIYQKIIDGESWHGEHNFNVNGENRTFMNKIDPIIYDGKTTGCIVISSDITELVENRQQAEAANLAKSQFLANMSHEIRTPMIGILGAVDLLEQSINDVKQLDNINIIRECGEQLLRIINEILDVSKIEIGLVNLNRDIHNVYEVIYPVISMVEPMLKEKGLKLELDLKTLSSTEAFLDPYKVRQILTNILFNAIKFTSKGTIKLKAHIKNNNLIISVTDTGIGIPKEYLPTIFDPFTQVDSSTSRDFGGTGLGLYICKKLVELMEGSINVVSELGRGSEFIISIPLEITRNNELTSTKSIHKYNEEDTTIEFIPRSILVVEDNDLNQKIVCEMLRNYGFEVTTAKNGLECLQILQNKTFDVILLDMQMPIMDGYETAKLIIEDDKLKHIPIIAMTAHAMSGDREKCLACGCTSYIAKPFKSEELVNEIKKHLTSHSNIKANCQFNNLFITDLIPEFINLLADMINDLDNAIENKNIEEIKSISHDIKGTSGMYGFIQISDTAAKIEKAAHNNSINSIQKLRKNLYQLYQDATAQVS